MTSQMWRRLAPAAILLLGLALFLLFGLERYFSFEMLSRHHATLAAWVADNTMLAVVMFVLVYALVVAFTLATLIGIIPAAFVYAGVGASFGLLFDRGEAPNLGIIFEWRILLPLLGLAALALVPVLYTHLRRGKAS